MNHKKTPHPRALRGTAVAAAIGAVALAPLPAAHAASTSTLQGWAMLPANTFSDGPTTGQFAGAGAGGNPLPLGGRQSVQGFSAVLAGPSAGSYYVMPDNGFGTQANSADALLRMYAVRPDFRTALGGTGTVGAADYTTGSALAGYTGASRITLADPDRKLGFTLQADYARYYNNAANPAVDPSIRSGRLLTGADLDIESVRKDRNGNLWFGDEFGPFLVKTDVTGKVLRSEISLAGVMSPQNPYLGTGTATLGSSRGFEGMAINSAGDTLYTLLEGTVTGDPAKSLRINAFDVATEKYGAQSWLYRLENDGTNIGDMTALDDHRFLVIERNGATATGGGTPFKKIYAFDLNRVDATGFLAKTEVVDLMNVADPFDLNRDGSTTFTFPYVTIEDVLVLDANTLLVINDNNYPGTGGRDAGSDNTEFLLIGLAPAVPEPSTTALLLAGLGVVGFVASRRAHRG
jgi:hypothetical protein